MLGPADQKGSGDPDGSWVEWEATQPGQRTPFPIDADDLRLPDYPPVEVASSFDCYGLPRDNSCGGQGLRMMMEYHDPMCCFRPERGTYHFSGYVAYMVYDYYMGTQGSGYWTGPIVAISKFEMDMLAAEAYIRMGQESNAWPLIDATRVDYGGLTSVAGLSATDPVVEDSPGRCTPHVLRDASGNTDYMNGTLWEAMKYEKRMETYVTSMGVSYFDDRGWGDLLPGTATMFPVPAKELLVLLEEIYTFGGDCTQVGSAPCDVVDWGDGGLKPLQPGDVVTEEDMRARVELFNRIFSSGSRSHATDAGRR
jgi:hypothetical protein